MIKISKKVEYSLIVLQHLSSKANDQKMATVRSICDLYHTPFDTTSKVMQIMCTHHILKSAQGVKGGYSLAKNLEHLSYYELAEIIEEKKLYTDCFEQKCSLVDSCNITAPIIGLNKKVKQYLENLTINELLVHSAAHESL